MLKLDRMTNITIRIKNMTVQRELVKASSIKILQGKSIMIRMLVRLIRGLNKKDKTLKSAKINPQKDKMISWYQEWLLDRFNKS